MGFAREQTTRRFFYDKCHPDEMGEPEVSAYVSYLATKRHDLKQKPERHRGYDQTIAHAPRPGQVGQCDCSDHGWSVDGLLR